MFPSSLAVIITGMLLVVLALGAFVWGWRVGAFRGFDAQARIIFDDRDLRLSRPWETVAQSVDRRDAYGPLLQPTPG